MRTLLMTTAAALVAFTMQPAHATDSEIQELASDIKQLTDGTAGSKAMNTENDELSNDITSDEETPRQAAADEMEEMEETVSEEAEDAAETAPRPSAQ